MQIKLSQDAKVVRGDLGRQVVALKGAEQRATQAADRLRTAEETLASVTAKLTATQVKRNARVGPL